MAVRIHRRVHTHIHTHTHTYTHTHTHTHTHTSGTIVQVDKNDRFGHVMQVL